MIARLNEYNETVMGLVRGKVTPFKSAAIAGILYAEQLEAPDKKIQKLRDAISFLAQEIQVLAEAGPSPEAEKMFDEVVKSSRGFGRS
jgi:hypothetical protein